MARFYASFDNSQQTALESNKFERKDFTNGSTLKAALISARSALSAGFYGAIESVNENGTLGITVPQGTFTNDGTNISFTNLYTNSGAVWPSDPSVRPTAPITAGNSTPVSPTDGGSFTASLYTDATTALGNALAGIDGGGPNGRIGLNAWRTLASLWHDHDLTYFAWDDFTPGTPQTVQNISNVVTGTSGTPAQVVMTFAWVEEYEADAVGGITFSGTITNNAGFTKAFSQNASGGAGVIAITVTGIDAPGTFDIAGTATFQDPTINTHFGVPATLSFFNAFTVSAS